MFEAVRKHVDRSDEIDRLLADPAVAADAQRCGQLMKERAKLAKWVVPWRELEDIRKRKAGAQSLLESEKDPEMRAMAQSEIDELTPQEATLLGRFEEMLLDTDEDSARSVIVEIRPGVGGDEAGLFAAE